MTTIPYVTLDEAQEYFDDRLNTMAWDQATEIDRLKALKTATRQINNLKFAGIKLDITQSNEFPRLISGTIFDLPIAVKQATCELAFQLLNDIDPNVEIDNLAATSDSYAGPKATYTRDFVLPHIRAGIPSSEAWALLLPYLVNPFTIKLVRKN